MIRQDYLLKYVEQLARVLAEIFDLKKNGKNAQAIQKIDDALQDLKLDDTVDISSVHEVYHESVADLLGYKGEMLQDKILLEKALEIYKKIDAEKLTYSMERARKMAQIKELILNIRP